MRYFIAFLVSLVFVSCSTSQDEIQSQIDIAVDKALKQKESDTQLLEEKIENLEQKIDELNEINNSFNQNSILNNETFYLPKKIDKKNQQFSKK